MARLFTDSCGDNYDAAHILLKWNSSTNPLPTIYTNGRTGNCFQYYSGGYGQAVLMRTFPNASQLTIGFAYKIDALTSYNRVGIFQFLDGGTPQIWLGFDNVGRLVANSNNADIGMSPPGVIAGNTWMYLEMQVVFATDNTGSIIVHVNGHETINVTGVRTASDSDAYANQLQIFSGEVFCGSVYFDDLYLNDGTTTASDPNNSGFLGDQQVYARFPEAAGQLTQWSIGGNTPAATNWQSVGETAQDDDTTYVTTDTVGAIDLYKIGALPGNVQQVTGVQITTMSRSDGGSISVEPMVGNGTTYLPGNTAYQNASYSMSLQTYGQNPLTGTAWQASDFETLEIGIKRTS